MQYDQIKEIARYFRNNPTPAEDHLWKYLKRKQRKGRRFLRQYPIIYHIDDKELFFFIADFFCSSENLIIELDGPIHAKRKHKDNFRDEILYDLGYRVLRIKNEELNNIERVIRIIEDHFQ